MSDQPRGGQWLKVAVAWILVAAPLAWGIAATVKKALLLFR